MIAIRPTPLSRHCPSQSHRLTGPTLVEAVLLDRSTDQQALVRRTCSFLAITSLSAVFSSAGSAYIRFSRPSSSANSFKRRTSDASTPPYFDFQLQYVASGVPGSRQTSFKLRPSSTGFCVLTICVSVNRLSPITDLLTVVCPKTSSFQ